MRLSGVSLWVCLSALTLPLETASATPFVSSTFANQSSANSSDVDVNTSLGQVGRQNAENLLIGGAAQTARSLTWRGVFGGTDNLPTFPLSFQLFIYADTSDLPDKNNVLSSTPVTFNAPSDITDTGIDDSGGRNVYEFRANLNPVAINPGTFYWVSVLADTTNDDNDNFRWTQQNSFQYTAFREGLAGNPDFTATILGPFYFVLDNAFIPEPATGGGLISLASLALARRNPRRG